MDLQRIKFLAGLGKPEEAEEPTKHAPLLLERVMFLAGLDEAEKVEAMKGTSCATCMYTNPDKAEKVQKDKLNKQGGTVPDGEDQMERAKESDLITMPGVAFPTHVVPCTHPKVKQLVNERMCCAFWDAKGTLRAYGKQAIGK